MKPLLPGRFAQMVFITSIWINVSEIFRYFVIVMPAIRRDLSVVLDVAPMNWLVFFIWGIWDTVLATVLIIISWLFVNYYGKTKKAIFYAATACWATLFLLFWVAMANMNLAKLSLLAYTLPLSWIEMTIGAWITIKLLQKQQP